MIDDRAVEAAAPMADHAALIARLEALTGPDREVDIDLMLAFLPKHREISVIGIDRLVRFPQKYDRGWKDVDIVPYTASLDAVIALVERELPGWRIEMRIGEWSPHDPGGVVLWNNDTKAKTSVFGIAAKGATPAIALCIALLEAKSHD